MTTEERTRHLLELNGVRHRKVGGTVVAEGNGVKWAIAFDERGRFEDAWRTDVRADLIAVKTPLGKVLASLGATKVSEGR